MDSIAGCFGIGMLPTGSEDPYALRRAALGLILILAGQELSVSLSALTQKALELLKDRITRPQADALSDIQGFLRGRSEGIMIDRGIPADVAAAVLQTGFDDIPRAFRRAQALAKAKQDPGFASMMVAFKRVANILPPDFAARSLLPPGGAGCPPKRGGLSGRGGWQVPCKVSRGRDCGKSARSRGSGS